MKLANTVERSTSKRSIALALAGIAMVLAGVMMWASLAMAPAAYAAAFVAATPSYSGSSTTYQAAAGGATFRTTGTYVYGEGTVYNLTMTKNGVTKTIARNVEGQFITNGKYLFYAKRGARVTSDTSSQQWMWNCRKNTIYRMKVKSGAKKKVVKGTDFVPHGYYKGYLYYGKRPAAASDVHSLYARKVKGGKARKLAGSTYDGICGGRVVCHEWTNANTGMPLYTYKKNGKGKKTIEKSACSFAIKIKGKRIVYLKQSGNMYRAYSCKSNGKGKKALSGWSSDSWSLRNAYGLN